MPFRIRTKATTPEGRGAYVSEAVAFELLCAQCIRMDAYPEEVGRSGRALGWYDRIRMLADTLGWEITITIQDK